MVGETGSCDAVWLYRERSRDIANVALRREAGQLDFQYGQRRGLSCVQGVIELIVVFDKSLFDEIKVAMDEKTARAA